MITTIETDDADHDMWCPECAYPLYQFAGDFGTGVFAPDGYQQTIWGEGLRCSHCNLVLEGSELEAYLKARQEEGEEESTHELMTPETCGLCHSAHSTWGYNCPVCAGGLAVCLKCGQFEAGLDAPCQPTRERPIG